MTDEERAILSQFENRGSPCAMFRPRPIQKTLAILRRAYDGGFLMPVYPGSDLSGDGLWFETLLLNDAGRRECGLVVEPVVAKAVKVAKREPQRSLF